MGKRWVYRLNGWAAIVLGVDMGGKDGTKARMVEDNNKYISRGNIWFAND